MLKKQELKGIAKYGDELGIYRIAAARMLETERGIDKGAQTILKRLANATSKREANRLTAELLTHYNYPFLKMFDRPKAQTPELPAGLRIRDGFAHERLNNLPLLANGKTEITFFSDDAPLPTPHAAPAGDGWSREYTLKEIAGEIHCGKRRHCVKEKLARIGSKLDERTRQAFRVWLPTMHQPYRAKFE